MIDETAVVIDAGPLIHLDELGCIDLLSGFPSLVSTDIVWHETRRHRPNLAVDMVPGLQTVPATDIASPQVRVLAASLDLAAGETSLLALAEKRGAATFLTDDSAARIAADSLGFPVHGTIGILVRAVRMQQRSRAEVLDILSRIRERSTLYIAQSLLEEVLSAVRSSN